jgi:long-chain acyl-CoA synthetase
VRTARGERFIPNYIENRIKFSPYVRNVAVMGAGRDILTAIVCIDLEATGHWAEKRGIAYTSYADLALRPEVLELVAGVIAHVNLSQPEGLRIRRFTNLHKDFDADDGEITRTRKLRRNVVEERYARIIDALYSPGSQSLQFEAEIVYEDGSRGALSRELRIMEVSG